MESNLLVLTFFLRQVFHGCLKCVLRRRWRKGETTLQGVTASFSY